MSTSAALPPNYLPYKLGHHKGNGIELNLPENLIHALITGRGARRGSTPSVLVYAAV